MAQRERLRIEAQALADTRRQARTDDLTGLANRRQLYEYLDEQLGFAPAPGAWPCFSSISTASRRSTTP